MLRLLLLVFLPSFVLSQCANCWVYGSSTGSPANSAQYNPSGQYICSSCQTSQTNVQSGYQYSAPQMQCNSCQYSPGSQVTTTASSSFNMGQFTCNNCQQQGGQYSCSTCQNNNGVLFGASSLSPNVNQQFRDSQFGSSNGFSTTVSPYGQQQYQNTMFSSTAFPPSNQLYQNAQYNNGFSSTASPYNQNSGFSSTTFPPSNQQFQNQPMVGYYSSSNNNFGYSTTMVPYSNQRSQNVQYSNGLSTTASPYIGQQYQNGGQFGSSQYNSGYSSTFSPNANQRYQNPGQYGSTQNGNNGFSSTASPFPNQQFNDPNAPVSPTLRYNELTNTNLGYPFGYSSGVNSNSPGSQPLFDQSSVNQNNDGTYVSGQYLPLTQGRLYDTRVGLTQFNTQVKRK